MKQIMILAFLSLTISTTSIFPQQIPPELAIRNLSEKRITSHQVRLEKELASHAKARNVLIVAGVTMTVLSIYKMIRELCTIMQPTVHSREDLAKALAEENLKIAAFAKRFGWFCAETAGAIAVNYALGNLLGRVMHDESLAWWITTRVPYQQTIELIEEVAGRYANAITDEEVLRYQERLVRLANSLCTQFELVLAFMRYKSTIGLAHSKTVKQEIVHVVQERISQFMAAMQQRVIANEPYLLADAIQQFKSKLNQDLVRFAYTDQ